MRASTLFGLTIAILIGMAVVFGVKSAGFFDRKAPPPAPPDRPRILVAAKNMYEGNHAVESDVTIRAVEDHEMDQYIKNRHKYMPTVTQAAHLREIARNIAANEPLLKEHFKDIGLPPSYYETLEPMHRAINLQLPKERAGGGIIRKNDMVDVYLTTTVCADPSCRHPMTLTAPIALGLKVIFKRDSIYQIMRPVADGPVALSLQARPYRAALIEFAKNKGMITVVPTGPDNKKKAFVFVNEGKDEERRDIEQLQGRPISDHDLEEIFRLQPIPRAPTSPAPEFTKVEIIGGVHQRGVKIFGPQHGSGLQSGPGGGPQFVAPGGPGAAPVGAAPVGAAPIGAAPAGGGQQGASIGGQSGAFQTVQYDGDDPRVGIMGRDGQPMVSQYMFSRPGSAGGQDGMSFNSGGGYGGGYGGASSQAKKECATCKKKAGAASASSY